LFLILDNQHGRHAKSPQQQRADESHELDWNWYVVIELMPTDYP
jgi:hypothetical protein